MIVDPRLETSSHFITQLSLCQVRLNHNAAFPWIVLIPNRQNMIEIIDLHRADQHLLMQEIGLTGQVIKTLFHADKLNVASLGNVVAQLHIHIIARYKTDKAWPNPVWNTVHEEYTPEQQEQRINLLKEAFNAPQFKSFMAR